ncbi:hypothetical protein KR026_001889, partial [Drosophila bipectinata]
ISLEMCNARYKKIDTRLHYVLECLVEYVNTTALFNEVMQQMDQIERQLDHLLSENDKPSIYKDIDDVLFIHGNAADRDCHRKRQIVQAIRRKLEWFNLFNGQEDTLFNWPWNHVNLYPVPDDPNQPKEHLKRIQFSTKQEAPFQQFRCLVAKAVRNASNHLS